MDFIHKVMATAITWQKGFAGDAGQDLSQLKFEGMGLYDGKTDRTIRSAIWTDDRGQHPVVAQQVPAPQQSVDSLPREMAKEKNAGREVVVGLAIDAFGPEELKRRLALYKVIAAKRGNEKDMVLVAEKAQATGTARVRQLAEAKVKHGIDTGRDELPEAETRALWTFLVEVVDGVYMMDICKIGHRLLRLRNVRVLSGHAKWACLRLAKLYSGMGGKDTTLLDVQRLAPEQATAVEPSIYTNQKFGVDKWNLGLVAYDVLEQFAKQQLLSLCTERSAHTSVLLSPGTRRDVYQPYFSAAASGTLDQTDLPEPIKAVFRLINTEFSSANMPAEDDVLRPSVQEDPHGVFRTQDYHASNAPLVAESFVNTVSAIHHHMRVLMEGDSDAHPIEVLVKLILENASGRLLEITADGGHTHMVARLVYLGLGPLVRECCVKKPTPAAARAWARTLQFLWMGSWAWVLMEDGAVHLTWMDDMVANLSQDLSLVLKDAGELSRAMAALLQLAGSRYMGWGILLIYIVHGLAVPELACRLGGIIMCLTNQSEMHRPTYAKVLWMMRAALNDLEDKLGGAPIIDTTSPTFSHLAQIWNAVNLQQVNTADEELRREMDHSFRTATGHLSLYDAVSQVSAVPAPDLTRLMLQNPHTALPATLAREQLLNLLEAIQQQWAAHLKTRIIIIEPHRLTKRQKTTPQVGQGGSRAPSPSPLGRLFSTRSSLPPPSPLLQPTSIASADTQAAAAVNKEGQSIEWHHDLASQGPSDLEGLLTEAAEQAVHQDQAQLNQLLTETILDEAHTLHAVEHGLSRAHGGAVAVKGPGALAEEIVNICSKPDSVLEPAMAQSITQVMSLESAMLNLRCRSLNVTREQLQHHQAEAVTMYLNPEARLPTAFHRHVDVTVLQLNLGKLQQLQPPPIPPAGHQAEPPAPEPEIQPQPQGAFLPDQVPAAEVLVGQHPAPQPFQAAEASSQETAATTQSSSDLSQGIAGEEYPRLPRPFEPSTKMITLYQVQLDGIALEKGAVAANQDLEDLAEADLLERLGRLGLAPELDASQPSAAPPASQAQQPADIPSEVETFEEQADAMEQPTHTAEQEEAIKAVLQDPSVRKHLDAAASTAMQLLLGADVNSRLSEQQHPAKAAAMRQALLQTLLADRDVQDIMQKASARASGGFLRILTTNASRLAQLAHAQPVPELQPVPQLRQAAPEAPGPSQQAQPTGSDMAAALPIPGAAEGQLAVPAAAQQPEPVPLELEEPGPSQAPVGAAAVPEPAAELALQEAVQQGNALVFFLPEPMAVAPTAAQPEVQQQPQQVVQEGEQSTAAAAQLPLQQQMLIAHQAAAAEYQAALAEPQEQPLQKGKRRLDQGDEQAATERPGLAARMDARHQAHAKAVAVPSATAANPTAQTSVQQAARNVVKRSIKQTEDAAAVARTHASQAKFIERLRGAGVQQAPTVMTDQATRNDVKNAVKATGRLADVK